jgi:V8-like Glu-specific endopeptidase
LTQFMTQFSAHSPIRTGLARATSLAVLAGLAASSSAQVSPSNQSQTQQNQSGDPRPAPPPSEEVAIAIDSGVVTADPALDGGPGAQQTVFFTVVTVTDAPWLRLKFDLARLAGDPADDNASRLRITSAHDGAVQYLTAENVAQWSNTSAFFNGDTILIELLASPGTGDNRLVMSPVTAGIQPFADRSICGAADDRALSSDDRHARHSVGCSAWLINDLNSMFLTAGHCGTAGSSVMQFKVPLSNSNGSWVNPPPEHQYPVDGSSVQGQNGGVGVDWGYYGTNVNSNTGLTPFQAYGVRNILAASVPNVAGSNIRITGYGTTSSPVSNTWNQVQKTHLGPMRSKGSTSLGYHTDTTGGNSGSCVHYENAGTAVGIHTHGGCSTSSSSFNSGTQITYSALQAALNAPKSVCLTGRGTATGDLFVSGDAANNFGRADRSTGQFAKVADIPGISQGMAWDRNRSLFYVVDNTRKLYTVSKSGVRTLVGTITGTTATLNGLAFDPARKILYAVAGSSGQLFTINRDTLVAAAVGSGPGGSIGGLEFDVTTDTLYGIIDSTALGSRLTKINTTTGALTVVGALGSGITDCNGLAYAEDTGLFYTINAANEQLLRVNKSTGVSTVIGSTNGLFGASFALSFANPNPCPADFDGTGFADSDDYDAFVAAFEAGSIDADIDGSAFVDSDDFDAFVQLFELGC